MRDIHAVVILHLVAGPAYDLHVVAGLGVEIVRHVADLDAFGRLAFDLINARCAAQRDADVFAGEVEAVAHPLGRGIRGGHRIFRLEHCEQPPLAAAFSFLVHEIRVTAVAGHQVEFIPIVSFTAFGLAHDDAAKDAVILAGKISVHADAEPGWIFKAHVKKCGTNRLRLPVMRRVSSRMPRPAAS